MSDDPERLRELFRAMMAEESPRVPSFGRTWEGAIRRRTVHPARQSLRLAVVGAVLILVSVAATFVMHQLVKQRGPRDGAATSISQWRSPTESLLRLPNQQLLTTTPRVGADALALIRSAPPPKSKGKRP